MFFLIVFQNRMLVFIQRAWSYFTCERGARLIIGSTDLPGWKGVPAKDSAPAEHKDELSTAIGK
jgi:NADH:ubiquinone reductase (H+-translocating)